MARYDFRCTTCAVVTELVKPMSDPLPDSVPCMACGETAKYAVPSTLMIGAASGDKTPSDVYIGRDAEIRWQNIAERQAHRDKVRVDAGQVGLAATDYNHFQPISTEQRKRRSEGMAVIERDGYRTNTGESAIFPRA